MLNRLYLLIAASMLIFSGCNTFFDSEEKPAIDSTPGFISTEKEASGDPIQSTLFRMVPGDFLGAGYTNLGLLEADPVVKSAFELVLDNPFQDSQTLSGRVDRMVAFSRIPDSPTEITMAIVFILYGDFSDVTLQQLIQENAFEDPVFQEYEGIELVVEEQGEPINFALTLIDGNFLVFGEESGVKAVLDTTLGSKPSSLADLGAALPEVLMASAFNTCPQYEDLGCTAAIVPGLAQGTGSDFSFLHVYEFEDHSSAKSALEIIQNNVESGDITQTGSVKISGDTITQDGRYIILEDLISIDEIGNVLE